MCGIFGYNVKQWDDKLFMLMGLLAIYNQDRGKDAFGWTNGKVIVKDAFEITQKFDEIPFIGELTSAFHTRAGTSGPKNGMECAHPWKIGNMIGMQNGFVENHQELNYKYNRIFPVDSMHLVAHMAEGMPLDELQFSGVFLYFQENKGPFFFRTQSRDLEVMCLEHNNGVVWSSDWKHLRRAVNMARVPIAYSYKTTDPHQLYELSKDGLICCNVEIKTAALKPPSDNWRHFFALDDNEIINVVKMTSSKKEKVANIGQWRHFGNNKEQSWVVCYHQQAIKLRNWPETYSCGCFENKNYRPEWPTIWRPLGEWIHKRWHDCWHSDKSPACRCQPFNKKEAKKLQRDNLSATQGDGKFIQLLGPASETNVS